MLTGRTRYRIGFRKKLVLQVEYWGGVFRGRYVPTDYGRLWRDATIEDMQAIERGEVTVDKPDRLRRPPPPARPNEKEPAADLSAAACATTATEASTLMTSRTYFNERGRGAET